MDFNYLKSSVAQAQANLGVRRSKVAQLPDPVPVDPRTVRQGLQREAYLKAVKAQDRFGVESYQYQKALHSRWL